MRYNHFIDLGFDHYDKSGHPNHLFLCDCGKKSVRSLNNVRRGNAKSCCGRRHFTHRMNKTRIHRTWANMKSRCQNERNTAYKYYGARGIKVCEEWQRFENFYRDMSPTYRDDLTLDRIDVNGNYCKENCRWATYKVQSMNKRNNLLYTWKGETMSIEDWAKRLGMRRGALAARLRQYKWTVERAFTQRVKPRTITN